MSQSTGIMQKVTHPLITHSHDLFTKANLLPIMSIDHISNLLLFSCCNDCEVFVQTSICAFVHTNHFPVHKRECPDNKQ